MEKNHVEFCDLSTHYFASEGIQVVLRYPASWSLSDGLRVWLCSQSEGDRLLRVSLRPETRGSDDGNWVQATLTVPPTELDGLKSGEYWLRCERPGGAEEVMCESFVICIEPRDIPPLRVTDDPPRAFAEGVVSPPTPTASLGSGSFILVEDEDEREVVRGTAGGGSVCSHFEDCECGESKGSWTARGHEGEGEGEGIAHGEHPLLVSAPAEVETTVATRGTQTDTPAYQRTALAERTTQTDVSSCELLRDELANMTVSSYVTALSEAEVSVLKSNNRDLLIKVRKLAERVRVLELEKEAESRLECERAELTARLEEANELVRLLRAQLAQGDAAKAALVAERDDIGAEKVALATERDQFCAEALRLRDECAALAEGRDALQAELQCKMEELGAAEGKVREQEEALKVSNDELKCLFERCTQLEGKVLSKENDLKVSQERLAESRRGLRDAIAEGTRKVAGKEGGGEGTGGGAKVEIPADSRQREEKVATDQKKTLGERVEIPAESREKERLSERGERTREERMAPNKKRTAPTSTSSRNYLYGSSGKLHVSDISTAAKVPSHFPPPYHLPHRPRDEFVTGVDPKESLISRKHKPRPQANHHHRSHPSHAGDPQARSDVPVRAAPPSPSPPKKLGDLARQELPRSVEGREMFFTCPICLKELPSRETELAATLHVEHCLKEHERNTFTAPPPEGLGLLSRTY